MSISAGSDGLTQDRFLGGRLKILQSRTGYRAGIDPVLLAAAVPAEPGESVLDLGCGVGTAALCLGTRVGALTLFGLEADPETAELARRNADANHLVMEVHTGRVEAMPEALRDLSFDHVITNPPYFLRDDRTLANDAAREAALSEETDLATWIDVAIRRLRPGGRLTVIHLAERLGDLLTALGGRMGATVIRPVQARDGRAAHRVIVSSIKGRRTPMMLEAALILHRGTNHKDDGNDFRPEIDAVLRKAAPLPASTR